MYTYEQNERRILAYKLAAIDQQSLSDRKAARSYVHDGMLDAAHIANRINWVLNGDYGYSEMLSMKRIKEATRGNRAAQAVQLYCALEYGCPAKFVIGAWKLLSVEKQTALNDAVLEILNAKGE